MRIPRRPSLTIAAATAAVAVAAPSVLAHGGDEHGSHHGPSPTTPTLPSTIALPNGFQPEGVATDGKRLYVGSIPTGAIYRADPRTGKGAVLVPPHEGRAAIGLKVAGKQLVVAGGPTGHAFIYDVRTGGDVADVTLTSGDSFVNDVAIGKHAAWLTDSRQRQLYRVDLASGDRKHHGRGHHSGKRLGAGHRHDGDDDPATPGAATPTATTVPISGDLQFDDDPATNESNGIVALPKRDQLIVVQSRTGKLFRVDGETGASVEVPVDGGPLTNGDGLLLLGRTLFVVQNRLNQIAVVTLNRVFTAGKVERTITSPLFRVPTTLALSRFGLYAVNARFGTPPTPTTDYDVVRVPVAK